MLALARTRVAREHLTHVERLDILDAESTGLPHAGFDIAVAMFVASVVPHPRALLAEMKRVVRPGGLLLFVNHFLAERGPRLIVERAMAGASRTLGWHPDSPSRPCSRPRTSHVPPGPRSRRSASSPWSP